LLRLFFPSKSRENKREFDLRRVGCFSLFYFLPRARSRTRGRSAAVAGVGLAGDVARDDRRAPRGRFVRRIGVALALALSFSPAFGAGTPASASSGTGESPGISTAGHVFDGYLAIVDNFSVERFHRIGRLLDGCILDKREVAFLLDSFDFAITTEEVPQIVGVGAGRIEIDHEQRVTRRRLRVLSSILLSFFDCSVSSGLLDSNRSVIKSISIELSNGSLGITRVLQKYECKIWFKVDFLDGTDVFGEGVLQVFDASARFQVADVNDRHRSKRV